MRIPHIISKNTIVTYEIPAIYTRKEKLKVDDFTWNNEFFKTLRELCILTIVQNWEKYPIFASIKVKADKLQILELLPTDLSLELTVPIIEDDYYWERCFKERYPDFSEPNRKLKVDKRFYTNPENKDILQDNAIKKSIITEISFNSSEKETIIFSYSGYVSGDTSCSMSVNNSLPPEKLDDGNNTIIYVKTWKQIFLEKYMEGELERMKPDMFNTEYVKNLTDLYGEYILCLTLKQLQSSRKKGSSEHISLFTLISKLPNLTELSVCFSQGNLGDEFGWNTTLVSETDCDLLGKGVKKSRLRILRVVRSSIDCTRVTLLVRSLCGHQTLNTLDLSHCKIGDEGAKAIAGMLKANTVLEKVILINNKIGPEGIQGIGFYLCQPECRIIELNLKLNPLQYLGGKYVSTALTRGAKSLRSLNLSCCGLTPGNVYLALGLSMNTTLQILDLSNNNLGDDCVKNFLYAMQTNTSLIHLDLRMCGMSPESVVAIQMLVRKNLEIYRGVLTTPPTAENVL